MTNTKVHKSYQSRFQTKKSRHLKTNYTKRRKMLRPNLKNYGAIKSRLVVRFTNQKVICQIVKAYTIGDQIITSASSDELKKYGLKVGFSNYSAAYATGLLVARRALIANNLINNDEIKPYQVFLDIGMKRNTKGSRCYAALKGAVDGGLLIPHNAERIFHHIEEDGSVENQDSDSSTSFNSKTLFNRIHGKTVADYMRFLKDKDENKYNQHFSQYIKAGLGPDQLEEMYQKIFDEIRNIKELPAKKERVQSK